MFNRLRNKIYIENPLKDMVKEELAYEFDVATYMAGLFYAEYGIKLGENEICDIALYIGASLSAGAGSEKSGTAKSHDCMQYWCGGRHNSW